ncbi:MAG: hypothetical protein M3300_07455, partial [Actinomycetota bacterium]|nr:hypothetical protein [Actinomycetota bacterium]
AMALTIPGHLPRLDRLSTAPEAGTAGAAATTATTSIVTTPTSQPASSYRPETRALAREHADLAGVLIRMAAAGKYFSALPSGYG